MEQGFTIPVLDKGFVRYLGHYGTDMTIVGAARVSYNSLSKGAEADKKLLHYLYKKRHTSPFEQCSIQFNIKMPIFCMREFVRHRTFKLNEMSARYMKMWSDFHVPDKWRKQDTKNKQGSLESSDLPHEEISRRFDQYYKDGYELYEWALGMGVAREQARECLPVALYTEIRVVCDLHNLMHFMGLRLAPDAQLEIRLTAQAMYDIAKELFPWSVEAFDRYKFKLEDLDER